MINVSATNVFEAKNIRILKLSVGSVGLDDHLKTFKKCKKAVFYEAKIYFL